MRKQESCQSSKRDFRDYWLFKKDLMNSPAKVVSQSQDVVFSEISASLDFYEDEQFLARILNSVSIANCDVDCMAGTQSDIAIVECDFGFALDDEPVFGTLGVFLVTETFPGEDFDSLDFKTVTFIQDGKRAPGSTVKLG
jgi:hypothetical protein